MGRVGLGMSAFEQRGSNEWARCAPLPSLSETSERGKTHGATDTCPEPARVEAKTRSRTLQPGLERIGFSWIRDERWAPRSQGLDRPEPLGWIAVFRPANGLRPDPLKCVFLIQNWGADQNGSGNPVRYAPHPST